MTIYTPGHNEKDAKDKLVQIPEVVLEPLTGFKEGHVEERRASPKPVKVTYFPKHRRPFCFYAFFVIAVMVVVALAVSGAVVLYKHMTKKVYVGRCGTSFIDTEYRRKNNLPEALPAYAENHFEDESRKLDLVNEDIEVSEEDEYEELHTPGFNDVKESYILHEFSKNFTAIVDRKARKCFLMSLNRTAIAPPSDLIDLLQKLTSGYYMPQANIIRENYYTTYTQLIDLEHFGRRIARRCANFPTYWVERKTYKTHNLEEQMFEAMEDLVYAMLSNHFENPIVFKLNIRFMTRN